MKYIFALLISVVVALGVLGLIILSCITVIKIQEWEHKMEYKYRKYHDFKVVLNDKILPWTFGMLFVGSCVFVLVMVYLAILKMF